MCLALCGLIAAELAMFRCIFAELIKINAIILKVSVCCVYGKVPIKWIRSSTNGAIGEHSKEVEGVQIRYLH